MKPWRSVSGQQLLTQLLRGEREALRTLMRVDLPRWETLWLRSVVRRNLSARRKTVRQQQAMAESLAFELDDLRAIQRRRRSALSKNQRAFRGIRQDLLLLERSLGAPDLGNEWNIWRRKRLRRRPNLSGANLSGIDLVELNLRDVVLQGADVSRSNLSQVDLTLSDLRGVQGFDTDFSSAVLRECELNGAWLHHANLAEANLSRARMGGSVLSESRT